MAAIETLSDKAIQAALKAAKASGIGSTISDGGGFRYKPSPAALDRGGCGIGLTRATVTIQWRRVSRPGPGGARGRSRESEKGLVALQGYSRRHWRGKDDASRASGDGA